MTIAIRFSKYIFSPEFSKKIHDFSEKHSNEPLKKFKISWTYWTTEHKPDIQEEMNKMRTQKYLDSDEMILKNMFISARYYYRKKMFKQNKLKEQKQIENHIQKKEKTNKKPYIGLSSEFICLMDETIKKQILQESKQNTIIKLNKKQLFSEFTIQHLNEIHKELGILKEKYDTESILFDPLEISQKIKKTFQNRAYIVCKSI